MSMDPGRWLVRRACGFDSLSVQERRAVRDFALLWSFYEGMYLNTHGSANSITQAVRLLNAQGKLTLKLKPLRAALEHFISRYFDGSDFTWHFNDLNFRPNDRESLVRNVLSGQMSEDVDVLTALLIIVLRLRNNLFHGLKWQDGIRDQLGNFRSANDILMAVIEMDQSSEN
jgi:hypothetical protein